MHASVPVCPWHQGIVHCVAFHPTHAGTIATGAGDKKIKIWNTDHGECTRTLTGHRGHVYSLA